MEIMNCDLMSGSRLVAFEDRKRNWLKHEERLIHIRPTLNTRVLPFRHPTARKFNYSKSLEIELQNKALLKKLTDRLDHRNDTSQLSLSSLPKSNRKKYYEEYKIKCENEGLYRRLREAKPMIDTDKMESERRNTERYLNSISKFGYKGYRPNKTYVKFDMKNNDLKYLSKRRIVINSSRHRNNKQNRSTEQLTSPKIIQEEEAKRKHNEQLLKYFERPRLVEVESMEVLLKMSKSSRGIKIDLQGVEGQQGQGVELQVAIPSALLESKFKEDLQLLIDQLRYNRRDQVFYIA